MTDFCIKKIQYFVKIADQYWGSAKLLWNLGASYPATSNLNHALELYLRAAWLTGQDFSNEEEMKQKLKKFYRNPENNKPHDFQTMFCQLPLVFRNKLEEKNVCEIITLVDSNVSKYGDSDFFAYDDEKIENVDYLIKAIRSLLDLNLQYPKDDFEIIMTAVNLIWPNSKKEAEGAINTILHVKK